jgi:DNA-binding MarR family transcriptional regulator
MCSSGEELASLEVKAQELSVEIDRIADRIKKADASWVCNVEIELSPQEVKYVEVIGGFTPSCMMRELADRALVAVSTATGVVDKLVKKGLVHREREEEDRRVVRVGLTDEGRRVFESVMEMRMTFCREMLVALNPDEREILLVLMRKVARNDGRGNLAPVV